MSPNITSAAVFGHVAAENACEYVKEVAEYDVKDHALIAEKVSIITPFMMRPAAFFSVF